MSTRTESYWGERAYETLVENASDIISRFDRDHRHLYVNRAITRATGLPSSAFVGKTNAEMGMPSDLVATWDALLERVFERVTEETAEFCYAGPDGAIRWFRSRLVPEIGADGMVESVLVVARDITAERSEEERRLDEANRHRQRAEDALRERNALLQALSDTIPDPIFAKDLDGRITFANPAALRISGRTAEEVLGRTAAEVLTDAAMARQAMENDQRVMRTGVPEEIEERVPYPDGTDGLWLSRKIPYRDEDGRVTGLLGISRDITDRKRAEQAMREAHAALQRMVASIADGLAILDREWRYTYLSETGARILGLPASDVLGRTVWETFPEADRPLFSAEYRKAMATGVPAHFEEYYPAPLDKWVECHCYPSEDGLTVYFRDVTERRQAEEALKRNELRFRSLVDGNTIGLVTANRDRILEANDAFLRTVGRDRRDLEAGLDWRGMTPREYGPVDEAALDELMATGRCTPFAKEFVHRDGSRVPVLVGASVIHRDPLEWICFVLDLTQRKAAEAERDALFETEKRSRVQAEEAMEAKDRVLATVSHELRNPLTSLWGWLELMGMDIDEEMRKLALQSMRTSVTAQKRMVDDLLDSVGLSRGTVEFAAEVVDLAEVATEAVHTLQPSARAEGLHLHASCTGAVPVLGDRVRLGQVLGNLLSNALKFTPPDGTISVTVDERGDTAVLQVTNTGYGIDPEFLPRIFERFTQERTHSMRGLGLGLSIVYEIVQRLGGRIFAASAGAGTGAQFTVELPLWSEGQRDA